MALLDGVSAGWQDTDLAVGWHHQSPARLLAGGVPPAAPSPEMARHQPDTTLPKSSAAFGSVFSTLTGTRDYWKTVNLSITKVATNCS